MEQSIEYYKLAYLTFIDLENAFDRAHLGLIIQLLYGRQISENLIKIHRKYRVSRQHMIKRAIFSRPKQAI